MSMPLSWSAAWTLAIVQFAATIHRRGDAKVPSGRWSWSPHLSQSGIVPAVEASDWEVDLCDRRSALHHDFITRTTAAPPSEFCRATAKKILNAALDHKRASQTKKEGVHWTPHLHLERPLAALTSKTLLASSPRVDEDAHAFGGLRSCCRVRQKTLVSFERSRPVRDVLLQLLQSGTDNVRCCLAATGF